MTRLFSPMFGFLVSAVLVASPPPHLKLVKAARLLDVNKGTYVVPAQVLIEGERIKAVGTSLTIPKDAEVIDLSEATLLPGLIDAHTHMLLHTEGFPGNGNDFLATTLSTITTPQRALRGAAFAKDMLEAGFTTIRDVGNAGRNGDVALREAIAQGWVTGPRMLASTRILAPSGGQFGALAPEAAALIDMEYAVINGVTEARKAVRQAIYDGADLIKIVVRESASSLDLEEMKAIVAEAHRASRKVAVHANDDATAHLAATAGVDSIEHGYVLSEATLRLMAQKGIFLVPTDLTVEANVWIDSQGRNLTAKEVKALRARSAEKQQVRQTRLQLAKRFGVPLAAGSDVFFPVLGQGRGASSKTMFRAYAEAGLSPLEILRMASIQAAELLGWKDRVGSLEAGKFADVIAVPGDPLKDFSLLGRVQFVMKGGEVVHGK